MNGIDNKRITRVAYERDAVTKVGEVKMGLLEMVAWMERAKQRGAKVEPNGVNGAIVITENRYFVIEIK